MSASPTQPTTPRAAELLRANQQHFAHWEKTKDLIDQFIDMMLNYRQSGHPGGSRSKVHALVTTLLGDVMRWDIRHPEKRNGDRFVLVAGHTAPLVYATLPVLAEAMRVKHQQTKDPRYHIPPERIVLWEDLLTFRRRGGLPGHAEMEGKTLFFKFNTGPSGHGSPAAAGEAMALKRAGAGEVKVFACEGEGGATTGATHEVRNSAWGLGLDNLVYLLDWNDFGIDSHAVSSVIPGTPRDWFAPYGWRVIGVDNGSAWEDVNAGLVELIHGESAGVPRVFYFKTRKGRDYLKYDYKSHGSPHAPNSEIYWETKRPFAEKYGVDFAGFGEGPPKDPAEFRKQTETNLRKVAEVLHKDQALVDYLTDTLVRLGDSVPQKTSTFRLDTGRNPWKDPALTDAKNYPAEMWSQPGEKHPNRTGFGRWGAWVNSWGREKYGRPLFLGLSADLAESTNLAGFGEGFGETKGWGKYDRNTNLEGTVLPQQITEFTNSGMAVGIACVNFSEKPFEEWDGLGGVCSTYGSFSYLKYGPMRLFSQVEQDSEIKVGRVIWVAGHSGPETADDSRTHFGIYEPYVTQLFPDGHTIDLHPWEMNEAPVLLAAGLATGRAILALHLTRPAVTIPDRAALGIDPHWDAARGAYLIRAPKNGRPKHGTVLVSGTMPTYNLINALPEIDKAGLDLRIVSIVSPQLWAMQDAAWRNRVLPDADWYDSMVISNRARRAMADWIPHRIGWEYAVTPDFDDRWRTGGTVDEVMDEAHLSAEWILRGIQRFVDDRDKRHSRLRDLLG